MNRQAEPRSLGATGVLVRGLGYVLCVAYAVIGSILVLLLAIGGLWEGFARAGFAAFFLAMVVYVYGTAYLAYRFARAPGRASALLLVVLVAPAVVYIASRAGDSIALRQAAETYALNEDPQAVEEARRRLLEPGRRAGRKDYVAILLDHLEAAEADPQRIRLVCMLGELSYQHEGVLEALRRLRDATQTDTARKDLHAAVERALLQVNPYEVARAGQQAREPEASADACSGLD